MKAVHVFVVVVACMAAVKFAGDSLSYANETGSGKPVRFAQGMALIPMGYFVGGVLSVYGEGLSLMEVLSHTGKVCGVRLLSFVVIFIFAGFATFRNPSMK